MNSSIQVQGRLVTPEDVTYIRQLIRENPEVGRSRISLQVAQKWDWRNAAGRLKDMAARSLLLKLQQRGLIQLPAPRVRAPNRMRNQRMAILEFDQSSSDQSPPELMPLSVEEISRDKARMKVLNSALAQFHYLGHRGTVGENLAYAIADKLSRPLAFLLFGSAAWKCKDRDQFIGWDGETRSRKLGLVANNTRFLILPWVRVPHLASWCLAKVSRRLSEDWQNKYGHEIALLETFVDQERFLGTAYQAANWQRAGQTTGRTRQDRYKKIQTSIKHIYVYALRKDFQEALCS